MNKISFLKAFAFAAAMAIGSLAQAADEFKVATGDAKGGSTYSQMYRELAARCSTRDLALREQETNGGVKNAELLVGNQVNGAFLPSDLLAYRRATDPDSVANVRTLVTLHPEQLHFIARGDTKKEGGFMGFGGKEVRYNTVDDLAGRPIGAVGGSVLSGRVVASQSGLNFQVVEFSDNEKLKKALLDGAVDSILVVGGAPHKLVGSLDQRFKLLSVSESLQAKLGGIYSKAKVSYGNLNQAGVNTIATQAVFATRTYRSKEMQSNLAKLRACFVNQLGNIQDATGTHPSWQNVDLNNKGTWPYYEF